VVVVVVVVVVTRTAGPGFGGEFDATEPAADSSSSLQISQLVSAKVPTSSGGQHARLQ
jgi:hypothetical protein